MSTASSWAYCQAALRDVSRTFSRPIELLPRSLVPTVTCGYLLCRAADTIEDDENLTPSDRSELFAQLLTFLHSDARPASDEDAASRAFRAAFPGPSPEHVLCRRLADVANVLREQPTLHQTATLRWVGEMVRGMNLYLQRDAFLEPKGPRVLLTMSDLERYCYFVAGTVGRLLTELFVDELGPRLEARQILEDDAEEFGLGLQLTNILKDLTDDGRRGVSYIPRSILERHDLGPADLTRVAHADRVHAALGPVFDRASRALDGAFRYTLGIPHTASGIRLFCLLPIWMAVRTLHLARNNNAQLMPERAVKISRAEVGALIAECQAIHGDDEALRKSFARLRQ
ncbi:MAG: squalene/phytoene synthase family protein [Myxococcota bacterium]